MRICLYDYFGISTYFVYYIHMNKIKFTYDKLESIKFGFNIFDMFSQVLLNLFTFLINTTDIDTQHLSIDFLISYYFIQNGQTNTQTDRQTHTQQQSRFNNIDLYLRALRSRSPCDRNSLIKAVSRPLFVCARRFAPCLYHVLYTRRFAP